MILGDLCSIYDGTHQTPVYVNEGVPFYSVEHVTSDDFSSSKYITEAVYKQESKRVLIERGDILMTRIGSVGKPKYIDWDIRASFYVSLALLKRKTEEINMGWLCYYIQSPRIQKEIWRLTIHVAFPKKINLGDIGKIRVQIPPKQIQLSNYNILRTVEQKINLLTKKKQALEAYKMGLMQKIFSQELRFKREDGTDYPEWEEKCLGELCSITTGKLDANAQVEGGEYMFFTCAKEVYRIDHYAFEGAALLISGNGANVGYIHNYEGRFNAYQRTYVLQNIEVNRGYLQFYLEQNLQRRIHVEKKDGNTPYIVLSTLSMMKIALPSEKEAGRIAQAMATIDNTLEGLTKKLNTTVELKKGLLQQMFV